MTAACVGVWLGWNRVRAANRQAEAQTRQAELARRDHVVELFNRAVGQLSDDKLEVRLGAVYVLKQISDDFPDLSGAVVELLTTYIRENQTPYEPDRVPADIMEIIAVVEAQRGPSS